MSNADQKPGPFGLPGEIVGDWVDSKSGLRCIALVGPMGQLNGYVAVTREHPWFGKGYSEHLPIPCERHEADEYGCYEHSCYEHSPDSLIRVHGGITYSGADLEGCREGEWWFGFDCAHAGDLVPGLGEYRIKMTREEVLRSPEYVGAECSRLAHQLAERGQEDDGR